MEKLRKIPDISVKVLSSGNPIREEQSSSVVDVGQQDGYFRPSPWYRATRLQAITRAWLILTLSSFVWLVVSRRIQTHLVTLIRFIACLFLFTTFMLVCLLCLRDWCLLPIIWMIYNGRSFGFTYILYYSIGTDNICIIVTDALSHTNYWLGRVWAIPRPIHFDVFYIKVYTNSVLKVERMTVVGWTSLR